MSIQIEQQTLKGILQKVGKFVSANHGTPIQKGIYVEWDDQKVAFMASNAVSSVHYTIPVDGEAVQTEASGAIVVPKNIETIVSKLSKKVMLSLDDCKVFLKSGRSNFELAGMEADEYPAFPTVHEKQPTFTLPTGFVQESVKKTAFSAADSEIRPALNGIHIQTGEQLSWTCTDSHRLSRVCFSHEGISEANDVLIPAKNFQQMSRLFDGSEVNFYMDGANQLIMECGNTRYYTRLIDGNYPDVGRLIPNSHDTKVTLNREELLNGLELLQTTNKEKGIVRFELSPMMVHLSTSADSGKGKIDLAHSDVEMNQDEDFAISFNASYAIDCLKAMDCDDISFLFNGDMKPFLILPEENTEHFEQEDYLILPVRTY